MPNRILRDGILDSLRINALTEEAELFYRKLHSLVDDFGRFEAEPVILRSKVYGQRPERTVADVKRFLQDVTSGERPLVILYVVGTKQFLQIEGFGQRERTSKFPALPSFAGNCGKVPHSAARASPPPPQDDESPREETADRTWSQFRAAALAVGMRASAEELKRLQSAWIGLDEEQKQAAVEGIAQRVQSGEYSDPAFVPLLENYVRKRLWTRPLRPKAHPPPQRLDRKAQARAEFLARLQRDAEVNATSERRKPGDVFD
jgi:hypothetical protein